MICTSLQKIVILHNYFKFRFKLNIYWYLLCEIGFFHNKKHYEWVWFAKQVPVQDITVQHKAEIEQYNTKQNST